ncbi:hypothetical protein RM545_10585 [Zunongwangia sp. F260]|uniref:Uncharacterized protein n=1 Tax=Autumnicola lenta TaxID=3075593 RepID=A0ABU3CLA1_9FLAO|nr:hypothetical protein [Zunongwangia sp. F260]MDT0647134.1 hypothetical protein [Zunongwangia sp. F260]
MKFFIYSVIILAVILIGYHVRILDFDNLLKGESANATAAILASFCVVLLMAILLVSRKISRKDS